MPIFQPNKNIISPFANMPTAQANPFANMPKSTPFAGQLNTAPKPDLASMVQGIASQQPTRISPVGQTDPSKVAASTKVQNPNAPQTTNSGTAVQPNSGQAAAIQSGAQGNSLVSQLYNGQGGTNSTTGTNTGTNTQGSQTSTASTDPTYATLLKQGADALAQSAALGQQKRASEQAVAGNGNYSLDTQVGRQGLIEANVGSQQQALADTGNAYLNAAGKAAPTAVPYSSQLINPLNGQPIGNGGFGGLPGYSAFQQFQSLQSQYPDANLQYDQSKSAQDNLASAQQSIKISPNYQRSTYGAPGATSTAQGASVDANKNIYEKALSNVTDLQNQLGNVDQLGNLLVTTAQSGGVNPSDSQFANRTIQEVQSQLSSEGQAKFASTLATIQGKISGLLSIGGNEIPTDVVNKANQILSGTLALSALPGVLQQIQQEGQIILTNQKGIASSAYQNLPGGQSGSGAGTSAPTGSTSGTTPSGITYTVIQ